MTLISVKREYWNLFKLFVAFALSRWVESLKPSQNPAIVFISFDGFRWDYAERHNLSAFKDLARRGVKAESLQPCFITVTYPNHISMVTGLYEESHGIISNHFYDPVLNDTYDSTMTDSKWYKDFTPIWISNQYRSNGADKSHRSGTIFYPTSNVEFNGKYPSFYYPKYDVNFNYTKRFDKIIELLEDDDPYDFVAAYFDDPDEIAHHHGTDSAEVGQHLQNLNRLLANLIDQMEKRNLFERVNLIIVSDHGMANVPSDHYVMIKKLIPPSWYKSYDGGVIFSIYPNPGYEDKIFNILNKTKGIKVYKKDDIPERYHYKRNRRLAPILIIPDLSYVVARNEELPLRLVATHAYDNALKTMHGIFYARGPSFKTNKKVDTIRNIDLYPLMCHILGIDPLPNNGSLENVYGILSDYNDGLKFLNKPSTIVIIIIATTSILIIFLCILIIRFICAKNRRHSEVLRYTKITAFADEFDTSFSSDEDSV